MSLTRLFVERPTLVTVFLALVLLAGIMGGATLVQQQFPNTSVPSIQVLVTYPGASTTEMRDAIVRPLEDQLAGAPNLDHLETAIQPGQASIVAVFQLSSDQNDDLVQVQGRVQNGQHSLPNDVQTPQISIYNPSEAVVVSLVLRSRALGAGDLSSLVVNKIVPSLEQLEGVSYVQQNGTVTDGTLDFRWTLTSQAWPQDAMQLLTAEVKYQAQGKDYSVRLSTLANSQTTTAALMGSQQ